MIRHLKTNRKNENDGGEGKEEVKKYCMNGREKKGQERGEEEERKMEGMGGNDRRIKNVV